jgi:hypothetical protein
MQLQLIPPTVITSIVFAMSVFISQANAQLYYLPIEIPAHPEVNPVWLGESFGVDGNRIYVGGLGSSVQGEESPSAIYQFDTNTLAYIQKYDPIGDPTDDTFGYSMEYYDGVLLIGAINASTDLPASSGAAYLISPFTGMLLETFDELTDAAFGSQFGSSLSINDVVIAVGAIGYNPNGAGRVFVYNAANNAFITALGPDPMTPDTLYGFDIAHNDNYFVVSAPGFRNSNIQGAVYVYDFVTGVRLHRFTSPVPDTNGTGQFGMEIELVGDRLFVGAGLQAPAGVRGKVTAYDLPTGNIITTLSGNSGNDSDLFGESISADGSLLVIGAPQDRSFDGDPTGAVYIFDLNTYQMIDKVLPPAPTNDRTSFGRNVKIQDGTILASSFDEDQFDDRIKSVYVLREFCRPDLNLDGTIDFFDISVFLSAYMANDPIADFTDDGSFDFFDVSAFLAQFNTGCS